MCTLVGTPEAVCPPTKFLSKKLTPEKKHQRWCQWLAGFVDGDGCFLVSQKGYPSLEITVASKDEVVLRQIQNYYGGSVKARAGYNAVRYRLHHKEGLQKICIDLNGYLRHPVRLAQWTKVGNLFSMELKSPDLLQANHGWFAGMFDADGCVTLNLTPSFPQITISVTQKEKKILKAFQEVFGGSLYYDKSQNGYWTWAVQSKPEVLAMLDYFKNYPCRSHRRQKLFKVPKVYFLLHQKAHLPPASPAHLGALHKKWISLVNSWKNLSVKK